MKTFLFKTNAQMKEYNSSLYWIDSKIIPEGMIEAASVNEALELYRESVNNRYMVNISKNALKNKSPMYVERADGSSEMIGYVLTASTEFDDDLKKQFIDLWVEIFEVSRPDFGGK